MSRGAKNRCLAPDGCLPAVSLRSQSGSAANGHVRSLAPGMSAPAMAAKAT
jgi:hypothetical protein